MNRRSFLATGASALLAGCVFNNEKSEKNNSSGEIPPAVEAREDLAEAFLREIRKYYENSRVFVDSEGKTLAVDHYPEKDEVKLEDEVERIVKLYADVAKDFDDPIALSVIINDNEAIVPESIIQNYVDDEINEEAYLEAIQYKEVNREE